jgi:hypothetical protein
VKRLLLILFSFAWLPFISEEARGCSCDEYGIPVCAAYWRADAVFAGQILDITPVMKKSDNEFPTVMLHVFVEQPFRGVAGNRVDVQTLHGTSCDMRFEKGKRYLIYTSRGKDSDQLFAGPCTRTRELEHATDDLDYVRTVTQQEAKESILGRLLRNRHEALDGLKVTVQGGDKTFETKTDEEGNFSVPVPAPGMYTVRAFIPFAAYVVTHTDQQPKITTTDALTTFEFEVQIAKNQCRYWQIDTVKLDLHATAGVSGNVLTASGRPVSPGWVWLVNTADPDDSDSQRLEDDGSFKFEGVAVGEYYLVLNPRNEAPDENDAPYPRTYYPNGHEASAATKIVVTEGAKLENLVLRVGPRWKERVVTGRVVWEDGRPPQNGSIALYDGDRYIRRMKLDEKGTFNFKVYGDFNYAIDAEVWGQERGKTERVSITKKKFTRLKLVLKRID